MDLNSIARYVRVFALPVSLLGIGLIFYVLASRGDGGFAAAAVTGSLLMPLAKVTGAVGSLWFAWEAIQLCRWKSGRMQGDCMNCGGHMSQLNGRYGAYRKCKYCGNKQQGW